MCDSPEYTIWKAIKRRCSSDAPEYYRYYKGKGIAVCKRWANSFAAFYEDMGPKPTPKHTLDRIKGNKGYYKSNCRWATMKEQSRNMSRNRYVKYRGSKRLLIELAEEYGMRSEVVTSRLRIGWSLNEALSTPVSIKRKLNKV
jgi:hypothetical protein